jgi:menaquinone-dependent protoporphyrinogen IX oxidase
MPKKAIILYATRYGSTKEIADELSLHLDLPARNVNAIKARSDLDAYDAIILGSPVYANGLLDDMRNFLQTFYVPINEKELVAYVVYGATKGKLDTDYTRLYARHVTKKPLALFSFVGRATKSSLSKQDYEWLGRFYEERLKAKLEDFDYFDENKVMDAVATIRAVFRKSGVSCKLE